MNQLEGMGSCSLAHCGRPAEVKLRDADGNEHSFCRRHSPEYIAMGYQPTDGAAPGQQALSTDG